MKNGFRHNRVVIIRKPRGGYKGGAVPSPLGALREGPGGADYFLFHYYYQSSLKTCLKYIKITLKPDIFSDASNSAPPPGKILYPPLRKLAWV